ncbi:MAG TPA: isocitrate/isopropylmalate family dehydrogenase, partial [Methanomassiliicoccales archaeon]|nr:isocitrate/isopropylmalate family dehydrogenase [Methanomassiliicoccales archaeon]
MRRVAVIPGDGIGPEVVHATVDILEEMALPIDFIGAEMGHECYRRNGSYLPHETIDLLHNVDCCLFGAITSPTTYDPDYRSPLLYLRKHFDLYANIRPVRRIVPDVGLVDLDLTIVRENTEGMYTGIEREENGSVILERRVTESVCRRLVRRALRLCLDKNIPSLTCVHKANVLRRSDGMFRKVFYEEMDGAPIEAKDMLVDAAAAAMIIRPQDMKCIVTLNLYGDILSDEAAALVGGLGFAPSANYGDGLVLFEPTHGSAPDIAGKGIANPTATLLTSVMMLEHLGLKREAELLDSAIVRTWADGI